MPDSVEQIAAGPIRTSSYYKRPITERWGRICRITSSNADCADVEDAMERIKKAPTIDAVEVVRCKDCVHYGKSPFRHPTIGWCIIAGSHKKPDWYCGDGERRSEE